jgi:hypothetical protein
MKEAKKEPAATVKVKVKVKAEFHGQRGHSVGMNLVQNPKRK